uniref:Ferrochelatase n=1 Tax=Haemonchus contortus TaxID=6289 RepID=A0A7I4XRL1_HAECO
MIHGYGRVFTQSLWKGLKKTNAYGGKRHVCSDVIKGKTHVLFLHMGQPRSEYYAKEYLQKSAYAFYQIPKNLERYIPMVFLLNGKVRDSVAKYGEAGCIEEPLTTFTKRIQGSLNTIMPEFGSISCSTAFLFDDPSIDQELMKIGKNGYNHIVVFPLYPHYSCTRSGFLLNEVERVLQTFTVPATVDDREVPCERIVPNTSSSFHVSALHRWGNHPIVSEYWLDILQNHRDEIGGLVFCAPSIRGYNSKTYRRSIWSTCERIMAGLDDSFPWRLSFFNAWDQWDLPVIDSIKAQAKRLNSLMPPGKQIALVPVSSILPDFNTFSVLPNIATSLEKVVLVQPRVDNPLLIQGVVEVIKNHLLGRRDAQLRDRCDWCINKQCEFMRYTLIDS